MNKSHLFALSAVLLFLFLARKPQMYYVLKRPQSGVIGGEFVTWGWDLIASVPTVVQAHTLSRIIGEGGHEVKVASESEYREIVRNNHTSYRNFATLISDAARLENVHTAMTPVTWNVEGIELLPLSRSQ